MFAELTQEHLGDVQESLGSLWSDFGCSWMILVDFQRMLFLVVSDGRVVIARTGFTFCKTHRISSMGSLKSVDPSSHSKNHKMRSM